MALALASSVALSCGGTAIRWSAGWTSAYSRFDDSARTQFEEARRLYDRGDRLGARKALADLVNAHPGNLELGAWLQDVESELLEDGLDLFAGPRAASSTAHPRLPGDPRAFSLADGSAEDVLRRVYAEVKDQEPTVTSFILAARAETDVIAAETLLERALELDPTCAWAHYARSHVLLEDRTRADRWSQAREALDRALELNPGHLRARRLEAWMLAEEGSRDAAEKSLGRWLEVARGDPRVPHVSMVEAKLDLALLLLLRGEDQRAEALLNDLEGQPLGRARRLMLLTVARQEGGDALGALDAALRAQGAERGVLLPIVQEAMLQELFLGNPAEAEDRWRSVAELSDQTTEIADLVRGLRARVRLERSASEASAEDRAETVGPDISGSAELRIPSAGDGPTEGTVNSEVKLPRLDR